MPADAGAAVPPAPPPAVAHTDDDALRRELAGWTWLAAGALGIAGLFALLLAISRVPGIEHVFPWPVGFFHKGLVIHVVFSFVVWFLAVLGALALLASDRLADGRSRHDALGRTAVIGTALSLPMLFVPAFFDRGEPTLNNYVPVIVDPLYYAGLGLLAFSIGLAAIRLLMTARPASLLRQPLAAAVAAAAAIYLLALICFAIAWRTLAGTPPSHDFNESLLWGGGHVLQFVNTVLLVTAWSLLAARFIGGPPVRALALATALLLVGALPAPLFYIAFAPFSAAQTVAFTDLQYLLGPAAAIVAIGIAGRLERPLAWREPRFLALALSILLFAVGGTMGLFVDGTDTRTPAHYHGVIAAITLAFFGVFLTVILPRLGRPVESQRRQRLILHLFAWGQLAACIGLFIAGGHGAPRKVAGDAQGLHGLGEMIGMGLNGMGGLVAIAGGVLFVWTVMSALLQRRKSTPFSSGLRLL